MMNKHKISDKLIYELFEEQVLKTPNKIAVQYQDIELTYYDLNCAANQLADYLQKKYTIIPNDFIVLYMGRSEQLIIAALAIFKSGGVYVPFDISHPEDRLLYMFHDITPKLILTDSKHVTKLNQLLTKANKLINDVDHFVTDNIIVVDGKVLKTELFNYSKQNLVVSTNINNLAYVIYTSGTTGKPKGILHLHKSLTDRISWLIKEHNISSDFIVLGKTPYCFDPSLREIFIPLLVGAKLVVVSHNLNKDISQLISCIINYKIDLALFVPSQMQVFLHYLTEMYSYLIADIQLKVIYSIGERLSVSLARKILDIFPDIKLYNQYGSSESCMIQLEYLVTSNDLQDKNIPIGYLYQNVYVLDKKLNQISLNEIGELYVGGNALSVGYVNDLELTNTKFIINPFQSEPIESTNRLYKSGDLVKLLPNDKLVYVGRNDFQVKLSGNRIELNEIEFYINSYPHVRESVVIVKQLLGPDGDITNEYLIGYYVSKFQLDTIKILEYLKEQLPTYMIPSVLIHLEQLPLTINGKLDRMALSHFEHIHSNKSQLTYNIFELEVLSIFAELLGIKQNDMNFADDFFTLGGNSLLAIKLVAKLNHKFRSNLIVQDIYRLKAINLIYNLLQKSIGEFLYTDYVLCESDPTELFEPFPLTNVQQAYYLGRFNNFNLGNVATHDYIEYSFDFLDIKLLEKTFNQLLHRHLALRTIFKENQQQYLVEIPYYRIKTYTDNDLLCIRNILSHKIYELDVYPLFDIFVSKSVQYILHISYDALLMDANSFRILLTEWTQLYRNPDFILQPLNISYRDYVIQFDRIRVSNILAEAESYWQDKLDIYNFELNLPLINKDSAIEKPIFNRVSKIISQFIWNKLSNKAQNYNISPTIVILAAYGKVLSYWSNQEHLCINMTLFNRLPLHEQINDIIGDFTILELFNYTNSNSTISKILFDIHNNLWQDIKHSLFDGIDCQRLIKKQQQISANQILAPVVLTSLLGGMKAAQGNEPFLDHTFHGINYSITQTSQIWLDNKAYNTPEGMVAEWDYVEQLFSRDTIEAMHDHYCQLIEYLADANWEEGYFPALKSPSSSIAIIETANSSVMNICVDNLFSTYEQFVVKNDLIHNIAVIDDGCSNKYSYADLIQDSELLAKYIHKKSQIYDSKLVAVLSEKGYNQVVGTLAIMKAGYGYLPLHIEWPVGRLTEVLDTGLVRQILISSQMYTNLALREQLSAKYELLVIEDILTELSYTSSSLEGVVLPPVSPDDIAYVIFTSGSTGKPKGVTISHSGALNTIHAVNKRFSISYKDKILALSELSFDLSVYDIFGVLAVGGTIVFPNQSHTKEPSHWIELVNRYQITLWNSVPQLAQLLVDNANDHNISINSLRLFLLSGDWIELYLPEQLKRQCYNAQVISLGGATEGSIWSIWYEISEINNAWDSIPYGTAMPNQKMYILNYGLEHNPIGVIGDIYIGGTGVALNYWQDEQRTHDSFILHPDLGRLYKTGDLGKWNKAGYIEFHGRKDNQIKVNGYRVELEEISNKLLNISGIKHALVIQQQEESINYLIGYLIFDEGKVSSTEQSSKNDLLNSEQFKLEQHGILNSVAPTHKLEMSFDERLYRLRKSYRNFENVRIKPEQLPNIKSIIEEVYGFGNDNKQLTLETLTSILAGISSITIKGRVLPKYRYPSGGSSYAVRCFLRINQEIPGLEVGGYYFNPITHALCIMPLYNSNVDNQHSNNALNLIVNWPAIKPLYGNLSASLAYIEAGHILGLLCKDLDHYGIGYEPIIGLEEIDDNNTLLAKIVFTSEHNTRINTTELKVNYLYKNKSNTAYVDSDNYLNFKLSDNIIDKASEVNQLLNSGSALVVFEGENTLKSLVYSGMVAQILADKLYDNNIGSCSLGYIPYSGAIYALVLGVIDDNEKQLADSKLNIVDLRTLINLELECVLPKYMLPYNYITLEHFPLTANGKIDLTHLPKSVITEQTNAYVAPSTELEHIVCEAYAKVLNLPQDRISIHDDFFRLGGNSLSGMQLVGYLHKNIEYKIKLSELYKLKTINNIASCITNTKISNNVWQRSIDTHELKSIVDDYRLSDIQQAMYLQCKIDQQPYTYNMPLLIKLSHIDLIILEQAILKVLCNHRILRMCIIDNLHYKILDCELIQVNKVSIRAEDINQYLIQQALHVFNLDGELLIKPEIVSIINTDSVILNLTLHHILSDASSLSLIYSEILYVYLQLIQDKNYLCVHKPDTLDYFDYKLCQEQQLLTNKPEIAAKYLVHKLESVQPLKLCRKLGSAFDNIGANFNFELDNICFMRLKEISIKNNVSIYAILVTTLYHVFHVYNQSGEAFPICLPVSGRSHEFSHVIGPFSNTLPLVFEYNADNIFIDNIIKANNEIIYLIEHHYLGFNTLLQQLSKNTTEIRLLMQLMFTMHNFQRVTYTDKLDIDYEVLEVNSITEKFGISITCVQFVDCLKFNVSYASSLYKDEYIKSIFDCYKNLLSELNTESIKKNSRNLNLLNNAMYQTIVYDWNKTDKKYSQSKTIIQLFEEQAAMTPNNIAVVYESIKLTYRELNTKINQLANYLGESYQINEDDLIAICFDRNEYRIITMFAVLKTGAAYVPLNSDDPSDRIYDILLDATPKVVLASSIYQGKLNNILDAIRSHSKYSDVVSSATQCINLEIVDSQLTQGVLLTNSTANPTQNISNHDLAYVIYTSGTTGKPKGVMIEHHSLINYVLSITQLLHISQSESGVLVSDYVFDLGNTTIYPLLINGGSIHIINKDNAIEQDYMINYIKENNINWIKSTPQYFEAILINSDIIKQNLLSKIILGGESCSIRLKEYLNMCKDIEFFNHYGPTETTIGCIFNNEFAKSEANVIGKPLSNMQAYVLDLHMNPVPTGVVGELYISGEGLARGYLNLTELTTEKFIKNPFQTIEDQVTDNIYAKLYKTGDLVYYQQDGNIVCLGRSDFQVKVRGYRIELNEIAAVIKNHGDVSDAIVIAKDGANDKKLIAYIVAKYFVPSSKEIIEFLREKIPDYMIPVDYVFLDIIPLTNNGKIDYKSLSDPECMYLDSYIQQPRDELELKVCAIFADILDLSLDKVGATSDFFLLGGNSILAIKLVTKINEQCMSHIKVADIFVNRTTEKIIPKIFQTTDNYKLVVKLNNTVEKINLFMVHPALAGCEVYTSLSHTLDNVFSCYGIDSYNLHYDTKIDSLYDLALYYLKSVDDIMLKTKQSQYILLGWSMGGNIAAEMASILESRGINNVILILLDTIIADDNIITFRNSFYNAPEFTQYITATYDLEYAHKLIANINVDCKLSNTSISKKLKQTRIYLFKAMLPDNRINSASGKAWGSYVVAIQDNNINRFCVNSKLFTIVKVNGAHHGNILDCENIILPLLIEIANKSINT